MAEIEIIKGADNGNPPDTLRQMYPKVNRNFQKLNSEVGANKTDADNKLEAHKNSTSAHAAQNITYSGKAVGNNAKDAIDYTNERIDNLIITGGDSSPEVADARGGYTVLGDRLNASDAHLADLMSMKNDYDSFKPGIETEVALKADKSYTDNQLNLKRDKSTKINSEDLDISQDNLKVKLVNLSDEVKQAMAGTTPIHTTPGDKEVTREKLADHAVSDLQIENEGIRLEKMNSDITRFDGFQISAKGGTLSVRNIRVAFLFDLNSVNINPSSPTEFTFEACLRSYDTNLSQYSSRHYWNDSNITNDSSGTINTATLQRVPYEEFVKYSVTYTLTNNQRYMHSFVFIDMNDPNLAADLEINYVRLLCNGVELSPQGYSLFGQNSTDAIKYTEYKPNNLVSISGFRSNFYQSSGKTWNILGDSLSSNTSFTTKFYHEIVKEKLGITTVNNYSVGGSGIAVRSSNTNAFCHRYTEMNDDADIITVFGGTNDVSVPIGTFSDDTDTTLYGACHILMRGLIEKYIGKKIGFILPLQRYDSGNVEMNNLVKARVDVIKELCEYYSIPCIDLWREGSIYPFSANVRSAVIPDGLHPNENGHAIIASKIASFLERL